MISLFLMSSFLLIAVAFRILVQYRRTGDHGVRAATVGSPVMEILPGTVFILTFGFSFVLVVLGYIEIVAPRLNLPELIQYFGLLVGLSGVAVTVISQFQMGDSWRIGVDQKETTHLITHGLYSRSRNPIYFGLLLFWIGLSITFTHTLIWLSAIICWACIELIVREIEEPYLEKKHGEDFIRYVARTNRYTLF